MLFIMIKRTLSDGRFAEVTPLLFNRARLHVAKLNPLETGYYDDEW